MLHERDLANVPLRKKLGQKRTAWLVGFAANLARVQRAAAIGITGTLRNTATDVLDAHAALLAMAPLHKVVRTERLAVLYKDNEKRGELRGHWKNTRFTR